MPRISKTPLVPIRKPGRFRNPIVGWAGGELCVSVCGFDFLFRDRKEAVIYLRWFEQYEKQHRRQFDIIDARQSLRNRLVKLPAHLFKTQNRAKVIKALRTAVDSGG
jgi:hypothetical protein